MISAKPKPLPIRIDSRIFQPKFWPKLPQIENRLRRKPVTIAAGFICEDGLLLCADTKITTSVKTNESKMVHHVSDDRQCSLTFVMSSDDLNFPRAAIQSCWEYASGMDFASATMESVRNVVQFPLAEFYRDHIYAHPDRSPTLVFQQLLVGIWLRGETALFRPHETLLIPVEDYECIGSGAYLAKYLMRQHDRAGGIPKTVADAALAATCIIETAIEHDEHCDGEVEMLVVRNNGQVDSICDSVLYPGDRFMKNLQVEGWRLLRRLAAPAITDETIERELDTYFERIRSANSVHKIMLDAMRARRQRPLS